MQIFKHPKGDPGPKEYERQRVLTRRLSIAIVFLVGAVVIVGAGRIFG